MVFIKTITIQGFKSCKQSFCMRDIQSYSLQTVIRLRLRRSAPATTSSLVAMVPASPTSLPPFGRSHFIHAVMYLAYTAQVRSIRRLYFDYS